MGLCGKAWSEGGLPDSKYRVLKIGKFVKEIYAFV